MADDSVSAKAEACDPPGMVIFSRVDYILEGAVKSFRPMSVGRERAHISPMLSVYMYIRLRMHLSVYKYIRQRMDLDPYRFDVSVTMHFPCLISVSGSMLPCHTCPVLSQRFLAVPSVWFYQHVQHVVQPVHMLFGTCLLLLCKFVQLCKQCVISDVSALL